MNKSPLERAREASNMNDREIAEKLGVSRNTITTWRSLGTLPRTEFTGETNYAEQIEELSGGAVTAEEILAWSRETRAARTSEAAA